MEKRIYVGNLPFSVAHEQLKELFSQFGEIEEAVVVTDKFSGRSKGFGFVSFKDEASAEKAIAEMDKKEVEGRELKVNEAKPMDPDRPRPPRRDFGGGGGRFDRGPRRDDRNFDDRDQGTGKAEPQ